MPQSYCRMTKRRCFEATVGPMREVRRVGKAMSTIDERPGEEARPERYFRLPPIPLNASLALGLIVAVVAWRTWAVLQWTFQEDDWRWVGDVYRMPLFHYLTQQYNGHLLPAQFAIMWAVTRIAPLNYFVAVAPLLVLSLCSGLLMWRLLVELFGDRPANLIPLAIFLLCPLTVPALVWIAAGLAISFQLFMVATLFAVLRYVRQPSTRRLVWVGLAYAGGLLFWEKSLLILPSAALFAVLFLGEGSGRVRLRSVILRRWRMWTVFGAVTALYLVWYAVATPSQVNHWPRLIEIGLLARTTFLTTIIPTSLGGPWSPATLGSVFGVINELPHVARYLTWGLFGAIVGGSVVWRRQAWRGWVFALSYAWMSIGLVVASNRFEVLGTLVGLAARYFADCVPALALGIGLAFMVPLDRGGDAAWGRRSFVELSLPRARALMFDFLRDPEGGTGRASWWTARKVAVGVVLVYATSALITGTKMAGQGGVRSAKAWLANAKSELAAYPAASIFDSLLPPKAVSQPQWVPESAKLSVALRGITRDVRWNAASDRMLAFDEGGRLRPAQVMPGIEVPLGPVVGCGYQTEPSGWFTTPLGAPLFLWQWGLSLTYSTDSDHDGFVTVDGDRQAVRFHKGVHTLILVHDGTAGSVIVESQKAPVCVGVIVLGEVRPSP
jgi:hypothetical protein